MEKINRSECFQGSATNNELGSSRETLEEGKTAIKSTPIVEVNNNENFAEPAGGLNSDSSVNAQVCAGKHFIVDFWGAEGLKDAAFIESAMKDAAHAAAAVLLHTHIHRFAEGEGVTGVALLAESHISIHTWPEWEYAAFDIFMCGNSQPEKALTLLKSRFKPTRVEFKTLHRGQIGNPGLGD